MSRKYFIAIIIICCLCVGVFAGDLTVLYKCNRPDVSIDTIDLFVQIINNSSNSVAMQELEIRYYYSVEGSATELCQVYYAQIGSSNAIVSCKPGYISLTFTPGAGKIPSGWDSGTIELGIVKSDRSYYNQTNDYSFDPRKTTFAVNEKITLYRNGVLIFGKESVQPKTSGATITPSPTASIK